MASTTWILGGHQTDFARNLAKSRVQTLDIGGSTAAADLG